VLDTLYNKVMQKLRADATGVKGVIVSALLSASNTFIMARRLLSGLDLRYALNPPTAGAKLTAIITAALLAPVYALAQKLVFSKVRAALGIRKTVVSGGGSLASHLDLFFEAVGVPVLNGWGLTETSPVLACRRSCANVRGSVGLPTPGTQVVVVDPLTHSPLPDGQQGLVLAAGPGVMAGGYLGDQDATQRAFVDGWFDTGDLGWRAPSGVPGSNMAGHIVLSGRAKDTIVLSSGKNIEPQPIEDAVLRSPYIKHVMLVGQDKRELGALVFPDEEVTAAAGICGSDDTNNSCSRSSSSDSIAAAPCGSSEVDLEALLHLEVCKYNSSRMDYHPEDHIAHIQVIHSPLSVEGGTLTRTMKLRRPAVKQLYAKQVELLNS
jgi:long-chain acyl-CoA synthetase